MYLVKLNVIYMYHIVYKYLKTHIMNRYSRIFHHITTEDVKRKNLQNIVVERRKEKLDRILEEHMEYIEKEMEGQKSNWRSDLTDS